MSETDKKFAALMHAEGVRLVAKKESWLMKFMAIVLFFNKRFMTDYITTVGNTIYTPISLDGKPYVSPPTLAHEITHQADYKTYGYFTVGLGYLFPQVLGMAGLIVSPVVILLSIYYTPFWLFNLIWLVFLLPFPAPFRTFIEMRGYAVTLAMYYWAGDFNAFENNEWVLEKFTGPDYYWMCPFKDLAKKELDEWIEKIKNDQILYEIPITKEFKRILHS